MTEAAPIYMRIRISLPADEKVRHSPKNPCELLTSKRAGGHIIRRPSNERKLNIHLVSESRLFRHVPWRHRNYHGYV